MRSNIIIGRMNKYLHTAANVLVEWLNDVLPRTSDTWWDDCVMDNLSYSQREIANNHGFSSLSDFDLAALLRIADRSWYMMRQVEYLPYRERECIRDMKSVRNNWAHISASLPGKDAIIADLETLHNFFEQRLCPDSLLSDVDLMIEEIKAPDSIEDLPPQGEAEVEVVSDSGNEEITVNSLVHLVGEPNTRGLVMSVDQIGDITKYTVFVNGESKVFYSGQILPVVDIQQYKWLDIETFRSYLTAYQINNPTATNLYSLNSARIDFVPYQFRPALKMIHADEPRILIADSVGVGKTIEAGLIIKELQARNELENVLIICPKPLVSERKWEMEMKRFDEDFVPVDGPTFRQIISDTNRDGEWPLRFSKSIVPYSILDSRAYEGEENRRGKSFGLRDLDPAPHFDLVIVDEAHHIRNGSMEKEKAFEYKSVKYFCDNADAVVMLTATPLQTSDDDLFTLLNILRPDVVIDKPTFWTMTKPNAPISEAASAIRRAEDGWEEDALNALHRVLESQWGENVIAPNPAYQRALKTLEQKVITREERVRMISDVESLHSFNSMLNRTRRKDIQDFCIRRPYTLAVEFTTEQKLLHDELLRFEQNALLQLHGNARSIPFMMSTIKRQAASCIFGLAPHIRSIIDRRFDQIEEELGDTDYVFSGTDVGTLQSLATNLLSMADNLPEDDPKFDIMMEAIIEKQKQENNKIILFSTFRFTLGYLRKKLELAGLRVAQVDGSVKDVQRQEYRARFELPKDNEDAIDIMLFTEVGSEGLDYQFCDMMINYDLPWNPMRIEQRIGRIDRRGQKSEAVGIYNVITDGTVDADIYYRCLQRIGVFNRSIGECDEILGEIASELDRIGMDTTLTEEERKIKLEQMADNEVRKLQELNVLEDEEKELFGFDLSEYMTSKEISDAENQWLSQNSLQIMVQQYLNARLGSGTYILGDGPLKQIRLSVDARAKLRDDYRQLATSNSSAYRTWDVYLKGTNPIHTVTFDSESAERNRTAFFVTAMHPLAKQAAAYFATSEKAYIKLDYATNVLAPGEYHFSVYAWKYVGLKPFFKLAVVCDDDSIAGELPQILEEAQSCSGGIKVNSSDWDELEAKQVHLWQQEKAKKVEEANQLAAYKLESLSSNFNNRKHSLETRILDSSNDSIRRMFKGELEKASERYNTKCEEIRTKARQTDIHTELIANGILTVMVG